MLTLILQKQKEQKYVLLFGIMWVFMYGLYLFLDILYYGSLNEMISTLSLGLVIVHQAVNLLISLIVTVMLSFSQIQLSLTKTEPLGGNSIPFLSFIFGLLTFGCAPCVITFLAAIGIAFTPIVLPFGNLIWKLILIGLMIGGLGFVLWRIQNTVCEIKVKGLK
jgi:hypothetical protein